MGRVGVITHRERHDGGFNIVHIKDAIDNSFATRETNVFVVGNEKPWISLPKGKGVKVRFGQYCQSLIRSVVLILCSFRLLRRGIVVVPLQLQVTETIQFMEQWARTYCQRSHTSSHLSIYKLSHRGSLRANLCCSLLCYHCWSSQCQSFQRDRQILPWQIQSSEVSKVYLVSTCNR